MYEWIRVLAAFVSGDNLYDFGTKSIEDIKVITPDGNIGVRSDERWEELIEIGKFFSGN